jgi:hypothetical protein
VEAVLVYRWHGVVAGDRHPGWGAAWALRRYYGALTAAGRCHSVELFLPTAGWEQAHLLLVRGDSTGLTAIAAAEEVARLHVFAEKSLVGFGWSLHVIDSTPSP